MQHESDTPLNGDAGRAPTHKGDVQEISEYLVRANELRARAAQLQDRNDQLLFLKAAQLYEHMAQVDHSKPDIVERPVPAGGRNGHWPKVQ